MADRIRQIRAHDSPPAPRPARALHVVNAAEVVRHVHTAHLLLSRKRSSQLIAQGLADGRLREGGRLQRLAHDLADLLPHRRVALLVCTQQQRRQSDRARRLKAEQQQRQAEQRQQQSQTLEARRNEQLAELQRKPEQLELRQRNGHAPPAPQPP